ncbi:WavE lipopolysaccharide synthesis family protein [Vibrio salinus]|uniref:WavE lipopolysaccharide synthesis family protein n=1 Tax=Vibrio salinus TaxID=2899784 RepID=UPI001E3A356A|nr:WavE lipopolysaccharide synthesis family protein [Vibrio salinus]MCE0493748.1 WavE lipopolysaccharide synthesis family protein [Vibrio salinus]
MMKVADSDITFVIQGPIQRKDDRSKRENITQTSIKNIRNLFPESTIIVSTWKGQNTDNIDCDTLLLLEDPGPNFVFNGKDKQQLNNNRQIYSTHQGLLHVKTPYAVKLRSDTVLIGREFVDCYEQFSDETRKESWSYLTRRVLTTSTFFICSHYGRTIHFHKSDIFDFGLTEDLLKIWPEELIPELTFSLPKAYKARYPATEQFLFLHWFGLLTQQSLHINSKTEDDAGLGAVFWPQFIANNLLVDKPENLGIDITERFYKRGNLALEYDLDDWKAFNEIARHPLNKKLISRRFKEWKGKVIQKLFSTFI